MLFDVCWSVEFPKVLNLYIIRCEQYALLFILTEYLLHTNIHYNYNCMHCTIWNACDWLVYLGLAIFYVCAWFFSESTCVVAM